MSGHYGPMLRALAVNRRDYRVLVFATAVGYTVVVQALAFASVFWRDLASDYGIDPDRVVVAQLEPSRENAAPADEVKSAVLAVPGVESFAWIARRPFRFTEFGEPVAPIDDSSHARLAWPSIGDEHLLQTLGLPLIAGRNYTPMRAEAGADVEAVVSKSLASFLSGKPEPEDAVGLRFLHGIDDRVMRIVGVVDDVSVHTSWVPDVHNILFTYSPVITAPRHFALVRVASADPATIDNLAEAVRGRGHWVELMSLRSLRASTSA
ncbi:MAG: ABC transporter permease, partial [Myxococcota bacterium]|nr:ABC transporter permease [Myxococcota bacterium]